MREVFKWNKNHITGEVITEKVIKESSKVIGQAKVLVYDKDGNLTNETFTENIITDTDFQGEVYRSAYNDIMFGGRYYGFGSSNGGPRQPVAFRNIVLGTADREEDKENIFGDCGDIIGWCPRTNTNAGSDTTRGVYNPTESYTEFKDGYYHAHLVYDFGTSQANGTFNSIWWSKGTFNSNDNGGNKMPYMCLDWNRPLGTSRPRIIGNRELVYTCRNGEYYKYDSTDKKYKKIINGPYYVQGATNLKLSKKENEQVTNFIEMPLELYSLDDGRYLKVENYNYIVGNRAAMKCDFTLSLYDKSNNKLYSSFIDLKAIPAIKNTIDLTISQGTDSNKTLSVDSIFKIDENGYVYMAIRLQPSYSGGSYAFKVYDENTDTMKPGSSKPGKGYCLGVFDIINGSWVVSPSFDTVESGRIQATKQVFDILGRVKVKDEDIYYLSTANTPILRLKAHSYPFRYIATCPSIGNMALNGGNISNGSSNIMMGHIHGTRYIMTTGEYETIDSDHYMNGDLILTYGYSAHTKLPNPVTKTAADTMKVQYDYYIQVPKIADPEGNYLTYPDLEE